MTARPRPRKKGNVADFTGPRKTAAPLARARAYDRCLDDLLLAIEKPWRQQLHLIDIENLVGSGLFDRFTVQQVRRAYLAASRAENSDTFVIASGPQNRGALYEGWPGATYMWRKGPDGADILLTEVFASLNNPTTYERLFIGSGDHRLATVADEAVKLSLPVTVISAGNRLSHAFRFHHFIPLDTTPQKKPTHKKHTHQKAEAQAHV
jgi:hypothetical protein